MSRDGRDDAQDIDRAFADIMSRWGQTAQRRNDDVASSDPTDADTADTADAEEPGQSSDPSPESRPEEPPRRPRSVEEVFGTNLDTGWRIHRPEEQEVEDFVPPRPTPPASNDVTFWLALGGIVGGPLWIIYLALAAPHSSRLWFALAVVATLGGFGLMIMRLPARPDPEDDGDDGAVV